MDWSSSKVKRGVKNRFVDFFAVVPKSEDVTKMGNGERGTGNGEWGTEVK